MENNWTIEQTKKLFNYVLEAHKHGRGLVWAFIKLSEESGRSVNSVRNYYYSQLKMFSLVPALSSDLGIELINTRRGDFELFSAKEINDLIENVLVAKAEGRSVRETINKLSGGSSKLALRLQNKYRSMIAHHRDRVNAVMSALSAKGTPFYNPYQKKVMTGTADVNNYQRLSEYISSLNEDEVDNFFSMMKKLFA